MATSNDIQAIITSNGIQGDIADYTMISLTLTEYSALGSPEQDYIYEVNNGDGSTTYYYNSSAVDVEIIVDPNTISDTPTDGDYDDFDNSDEDLDPDYTSADDLALDVAPLLSETTQFTLDMPEDNQTYYNILTGTDINVVTATANGYKLWSQTITDPTILGNLAGKTLTFSGKLAAVTDTVNLQIWYNNNAGTNTRLGISSDISNTAPGLATVQVTVPTTTSLTLSVNTKNIQGATGAYAGLVATTTGNTSWTPNPNETTSVTQPIAITATMSDEDFQAYLAQETLFRQPEVDEFVFGQSEDQGAMGVYSSDLNLIVGQVAIPTAPTITENTQNVAGAYGQRWLGNNYGAKEFDIPVTILARGNEQVYRDAIESVGSALIALNNVEQPITFGQFPDRVYYGHFTDLPTFTFIEEGSWDAQATLKFLASNPLGYLDQEQKDVDSTNFNHIPEGNGPAYPIVHYEFKKDYKQFGFSTDTGDKVLVGYSNNEQVPDLKPVVYQDNAEDLSTFTKVTSMVKKNYGLAYGNPDSNATGKISDSGNSIQVDKFYKDNAFDFKGGTMKNQSYGLLLETGTFSTKTPSGDYAWQVDVRLNHQKYYGRALQRVEVYLLNQNGSRIGRFGITDKPNGAAPDVYMLFGGSTKKEAAWKAKGYGYQGHGNTTYAKKESDNDKNAEKKISYTVSQTLNGEYRFSQSLSRKVRTTVYSRELGSKSASGLKSVVQGTKTETTKVEDAEIAFKYDDNGKLDVTSKGNAYLYDAYTGKRLTWVVEPKGGSKHKGDYVTTADFDTIRSTENDDDKINDIIEATSLSWTLKSNVPVKSSVNLNTVTKKKKTVKKKGSKKSTTSTIYTSKPIDYTATRSVKYTKKVFKQTSKDNKGTLTTMTYITKYENSDATGNNGKWKKISGPVKATTATKVNQTRSKINESSIPAKGVISTLTDYNNDDALSRGFYGFELKSIGKTFSILVYELDPTTAKAIPGHEILKKTWTMPSDLAGRSLSQLGFYFGKTPILEDKLGSNKKAIKSYTDDVLNITDIKVRKLYTDADVDVPHIIVKKGDTADINTETEDVYINGKLANQYVAVDSTFPAMNGGKQTTYKMVPAVSGADISLTYVPTMR